MKTIAQILKRKDIKLVPETMFSDCQFYYSVPEDNTFVGMEIELENSALSGEIKYPHNKYWITKEDGSLRNKGIELVSALGITARYLFCLLKTLELEIKDGNLFEDIPEVNYRTGLHVHINILDKSILFLYKFLCLYLIFEKALFNVSGGREKNIHCVPLIEQDNTLKWFLAFPKRFEKDIRLYQFSREEQEKYSALNLKTIESFGTIEFRHHEGTLDFTRISNWLLIILDLYNSANIISEKELTNIVETLNTHSNYQALVKSVFPRTHRLLNYPGLVFNMREGVYFLKESIIEGKERVQDYFNANSN